MDIFSNASGTMSPSFKIGKKGSSIIYSKNEPLSTLGVDGDWALVSQSPPRLLVKDNGEWININAAKLVTIAASVTLQPIHPNTCFLCDHTAAITITLESIPVGHQLIIKDVSGTASTNNITIAGNNLTIDSTSPVILSSDYASVTLLSTGGGYIII